jgi:hypothetical protein
MAPLSQRLRASFTDYSRAPEWMAQPPQAASVSADARVPVSWLEPSELCVQAQASPEPKTSQAPAP